MEAITREQNPNDWLAHGEVIGLSSNRRFEQCGVDLLKAVQHMRQTQLFVTLILIGPNGSRHQIRQGVFSVLMRSTLCTLMSHEYMQTRQTQL